MHEMDDSQEWRGLHSCRVANFYCFGSSAEVADLNDKDLPSLGWEQCGLRLGWGGYFGGQMEQLGSKQPEGLGRQGQQGFSPRLGGCRPCLEKDGSPPSAWSAGLLTLSG